MPGILYLCHKVTGMESFYEWDGDILVLNVLGTPGAKLNKIGKVKGNELKISVSAAPTDGKATDFMVAFLAKEFKVPRRDIEVVFGQFSIHKQLRIKNPQQLPAGITRKSIS